MEALGLAAGMSYARNWKGSVKWHVDNMGAISNFWAMPGSVANDWSKCLGILILCRVKYWESRM